MGVDCFIRIVVVEAVCWPGFVICESEWTGPVISVRIRNGHATPYERSSCYKYYRLAFGDFVSFTGGWLRGGDFE